MSISSILSRPLNINGDGLGSEMGVIRLLQEGNLEVLKELLNRGLNPDSKFCHPSYKDLSLSSFVLLNESLELQKKLELLDLLLESGAKNVSEDSIRRVLSLMTPMHLEMAARLLFLVDKSLWERIVTSCANERLRYKLSPILSARSVFEIIQHKHYRVFRAAVRTSCLKNMDVFSLRDFNINDNVEGKGYTLLHFASHHLSIASAKEKSNKEKLEKVVLTLLDLGADALQVTEDESSSSTSSASSRKRKASSLGLMFMSFKKNSQGDLSSEVQKAIWESSIKSLLLRHPLSKKGGNPLSEERAAEVAKAASSSFISNRK